MSNLPTEIKDDSGENPFAIYNLVPGVMQGYIDVIPDEAWELSNLELEEKAKAGELEQKLKLNFWSEYERACRNEDVMKMTHVYKGVCSQTHFLKSIISNTYKLAFILTPFEEVTLTQRHLLHLAYRKEAEVLSLPLERTKIFITKDGEKIETTEVDSKLAAVVSKMRESLENRIMGSAVHRSQQVNRNINENYNQNGAPPISVDELAKLKPEQLEAFVKALQSGNKDETRLVIESSGLKTDDSKT